MDDYGHWPGELTPVTHWDLPVQPLAAADPEAEHKAFATLQARVALRGYRLERTEADDSKPLFVITRKALARQLCALCEVRQLLEAIGGCRMKARVARALANLELFDAGEPAVLSPVMVRQLRDSFDTVRKVAVQHDAQFAAIAVDIRTAGLLQRVMRRRRGTPV